jgi:hypothetical protein
LNQCRIRADQRERGEHRPAPAVIVGDRVVVADHDEQHGQRDVVVVKRTLLGAQALKGIGRPVLELCRDQLALARDDHEKDVGGHDRAERGPDVDVRGATAEQQRETPGGRGRERKADRREGHWARGEGGIGERGRRRANQTESAKTDGYGRRERQRALGVEQVRRSAHVDEHEQREAAQPGRVRLHLNQCRVLGSASGASSNFCTT